MIGRADTAVPLSALLAEVGLSFVAGDILKIGSIDGMTLSYPYEELMGVSRYYYPHIFEGSAEGRTPLEPLLTVRQNVVLRSAQAGSEPPVGDTVNAYRFIFGQSEDDFTGNVKVVDRLVKYVTSVTVVKSSDSRGDVDGDGLLTSSDLVLMARVMLGQTNPTEAQRVFADMDDDALITALDLMRIARRLVGL
jgi:hypothetical protein